MAEQCRGLAGQRYAHLDLAGRHQGYTGRRQDSPRTKWRNLCALGHQAQHPEKLQSRDPEGLPCNPAADHSEGAVEAEAKLPVKPILHLEKAEQLETVLLASRHRALRQPSQALSKA